MNYLLSRSALSFALLAVLTSALNFETDQLPVGPQQASYGVDCSWPIHSIDFETNSCGGLLGNRQKFYDDLIASCFRAHGYRCYQTEEDRIRQLRRQPKSLLNYTANGYAKIRAPKQLYKIVSKHWERARKKNHHDDDFTNPQWVESWSKGHTYVNYWEHNTTYYGISFEELGGSKDLEAEILDLVQPIIEQWTGQELRPTSLYGIRVYHQGAILAPHVDRNPLISSAIINVAQDPDMTEDWPLEVYGRNGKAVNISMAPGDLVLYESGTLIHSRPFPLQGKYYANVFLHFEPTGRALEHADDEEMYYGSPKNPAAEEDGIRLPPYIIPDSEDADYFVTNNPMGWQVKESEWEEEFSSEDDEDEDEDDDEDEELPDFLVDEDEEDDFYEMELFDDWGDKYEDNEADSSDAKAGESQGHETQPNDQPEKEEASPNVNSPICLNTNKDPALAPAECQSEGETQAASATA